MKCEEFEAIGLGRNRESAPLDGPDALELAAALDHANHCARCAALQESWAEAQVELRELRDATQDVGAPLRVEMRLRQEFHTRHKTLKARAAAVMVAWALAGAAVLIGGVSWWNWRLAQDGGQTQSASNAASPAVTSASLNTAADENASDSTDDATLVADTAADDYTVLPGSLPQETGDAAVVRVRLQRGALGALGLPVNEARAGEWIQVDLFVGQDGQPQAVRLPRE